MLLASYKFALQELRAPPTQKHVVSLVEMVEEKPASTTELQPEQMSKSFREKEASMLSVKVGGVISTCCKRDRG